MFSLTMWFTVCCNIIVYTIIFITGEAVNNAAGLGFNGYDDKGNAKWDLLNNVKIYELEVCIVRNFKKKWHSFPVPKW